MEDNFFKNIGDVLKEGKPVAVIGVIAVFAIWAIRDLSK